MDIDIICMENSSPPSDLSQQPDAELVRMAKTRPHAFLELYRRYVRGVYRYHLSRLGNHADAEDQTAQTFLAALESLMTYRGIGSFRGWLFSIAHHKTVDLIRRAKDDVPLEDGEALPLNSDAIDAVVETRLDFERAAGAMRMIPPERAEAIALRIFAGLSTAETSAVMGKSEAAVKMLVHRGLNDLRNLLVDSGKGTTHE